MEGLFYQMKGGEEEKKEKEEEEEKQVEEKQDGCEGWQKKKLRTNPWRLKTCNFIFVPVLNEIKIDGPKIDYS